MFSAILIVASSAGVLLFPQGFLKALTYAIIASVMLAAVLSITVLPALLGILGRNIDALGVRTLLHIPLVRNTAFLNGIALWFADRTQRTKTRREVENGFWGRLVTRVIKRPLIYAVPIITGMVLLILPLGQLSLGGISEKYLPPTNSVRQAQEQFDATFPGFRTEPLTLVITHNDAQPVTDEQVAEIRNRAMAIPGFTIPEAGQAAMWAERSRLDGATREPDVRVIQNGLIDRNDAAGRIRALRDLPAPEGLTVRVGGTPALEQDSIQGLFDKLPLMILVLITTTTLLMFLAFGSLVLPIKAAIMSVLTLGSTMGVLTAMFVDGHFSSWLNFTPQPLSAPVLGLVIAIIYGLCTDYEVFLVSRMIEARAQGTDVAFHFKQYGEYRPVPVVDDDGFAFGRAYDHPCGGRMSPTVRVPSPGASGMRGAQTRLLEPGECTTNTVMLDRDTIAVRVGKRRAGRDLDGRTWDQYPAAVTETPVWVGTSPVEALAHSQGGPS